MAQKLSAVFLPKVMIISNFKLENFTTRTHTKMEKDIRLEKGHSDRKINILFSNYKKIRL